jgi:hypothetical protein
VRALFGRLLMGLGICVVGVGLFLGISYHGTRLGERFELLYLLIGLALFGLGMWVAPRRP